MEKEPIRVPLFVVVGIGVAALNVGMGIGRQTEHADQRVQKVQVTNQQLYGQLAARQAVQELRVNDERKTFRFHTTDSQGTLEVCSGKYQENNHVATTLGNLSCTKIVPAG